MGPTILKVRSASCNGQKSIDLCIILVTKNQHLGAIFNSWLLVMMDFSSSNIWNPVKPLQVASFSLMATPFKFMKSPSLWLREYEILLAKQTWNQWIPWMAAISDEFPSFQWFQMNFTKKGCQNKLLDGVVSWIMSTPNGYVEHRNISYTKASWKMGTPGRKIKNQQTHATTQLCLICAKRLAGGDGTVESNVTLRLPSSNHGWTTLGALLNIDCAIIFLDLLHSD